jgi:hypothetical protein
MKKQKKTKRLDDLKIDSFVFSINQDVSKRIVAGYGWDSRSYSFGCGNPSPGNGDTGTPWSSACPTRGGNSQTCSGCLTSSGCPTSSGCATSSGCGGGGGGGEGVGYTGGTGIGVSFC